MKSNYAEFTPEKLRLLSRAEMDMLIYMTGDIWITPELKRFMNEIMEKIGGKQ